MTAPARNPDLHGSAPDTAGAALLMIDVINDLEFDGGDRMLGAALAMARALAPLKRRCHAMGIPVVYVNDNAGKWREDQRTIVARCLEEDVRGRPVAELLAPGESDYFVIKPKHSAFFSTPLDTLLRYLRVHTLILTGIGTNLCVLFTASDAYMRDYLLVVPPDCVVAQDPADGERAVAQMRKDLKADTYASTELDLSVLNGRGLSASPAGPSSGSRAIVSRPAGDPS